MDKGTSIQRWNFKNLIKLSHQPLILGHMFQVTHMMISWKGKHKLMEIKLFLVPQISMQIDIYS